MSTPLTCFALLSFDLEAVFLVVLQTHFVSNGCNDIVHTLTHIHQYGLDGSVDKFVLELIVLFSVFDQVSGLYVVKFQTLFRAEPFSTLHPRLLSEWFEDSV